MSDQPLLMIAAGGTGGHMFPAQALAEAMLQRGWRVKLSTDPRGARFTDGFPHSVEIEVVESGTFGRAGLKSKIAAPFAIAKGVMGARRSMRKDRPAVVAGFGGYPAFPAMAAAWLLRRPRLLHEQNGVLGKVNRFFARRVHRVACGTWPTDLPPGVEGIHTGNPVRAAVMEKAGSQYMEPGDYPMSIVIIGGSQGAHILSEVVPAAMAILPAELKAHLRLSHQAREEDLETVKTRYQQFGIAAEVQPFFRDVPRRISEAQLVISRAGASSVADITVIGRPSILIPLAAALRDEQTANAKGLVDAGGAYLLVEKGITALDVAKHIHSVLADPDVGNYMAAAAVEYGKPDATEALVELVEGLAEKARS